MAPAYIMSIYVPVTAVSFLPGRFRSMQGRTQTTASSEYVVLVW